MIEQRIEWSAGEMIGRGWAKVKADPVGVVLPLFVVSLTQGTPEAIISQFAEQAQKEPDANTAVSAGLHTVAVIVNLLLSAFFTGGVVTFLLNVVRGLPYSFGDVFTGGRYFGTMLLTSILAGGGTMLGLMLCIVPGVILALGWSLAALVVVDKKLSALAAIKESWRLTNGHKATIFVYGLLSFCVAILGLLICCVGVIPASAVIALGQVFIYEQLTSASLLHEQN